MRGLQDTEVPTLPPAVNRTLYLDEAKTLHLLEQLDLALSGDSLREGDFPSLSIHLSLMNGA